MLVDDHWISMEILYVPNRRLPVNPCVSETSTLCGQWFSQDHLFYELAILPIVQVAVVLVKSSLFIFGIGVYHR